MPGRSCLNAGTTHASHRLLRLRRSPCKRAEVCQALHEMVSVEHLEWTSGSCGPLAGDAARRRSRTRYGATPWRWREPAHTGAAVGMSRGTFRSPLLTKTEWRRQHDCGNRASRQHGEHIPHLPLRNRPFGRPARGGRTHGSGQRRHSPVDGRTARQGRVDRAGDGARKGFRPPR